MNRAKLNYLVDFSMFISFLVTAITGLILKFFLSSGKRSGQNEFLGIIKGNWELVHDWIGILLIFIVIIHIVLHWNWIVSMTRGLFKRS